jgi:hypothetical protein
MGVTISDRARFDKLIDARSIEPELYLDLDQISALRGNRVRIRGL